MPVAVDPLNPNKKGKPKLPLSNLFAVAVYLLLLLGDGIFEVFTGLERRNGLCGRLDLLTGLRVHASRRFSPASFKFAKPGNDHRFALFQRCCNYFHHTVQCRSCILLCEPRLLRELLNEFCFVHVYPLGL